MANNAIMRIHLIHDDVPSDDFSIIDAYVVDEDGISTDLNDMLKVDNGLKIDAGTLMVDAPEYPTGTITATNAAADAPTATEFNALVSAFNTLVSGLKTNKLIIEQ